MHYVYILQCRDGSLYVGETSNIHMRMKRHANGTACTYTASRGPVSLIYAETLSTKTAALARERQLKGWSKAKKTALITGDLKLLKRL